MWRRFKSRRRHVSFEFVAGSVLCSERFFSGFSGFPLSSKTNISKFQFDPESDRRRTTYWMCYLQIIIYWFYLFIYLFPTYYQYVRYKYQLLICLFFLCASPTWLHILLMTFHRCYLVDNVANLVTDPDFLLVSTTDAREYERVSLGRKEGDIMKLLVTKHKFFVPNKRVDFQGICSVSPYAPKVSG